MSIGFSVAMAVVPFLDLLDSEEEALAESVREATGEAAVSAAMESSRRRLAQGVDAVVRGLPAVIRNDLTASRAVAYALIGLADERMLHHPAGGLERWRERLLEFDLYGSALAGQEVTARAQAAARGETEGETATLAPLYLAVFRSGFEGSLRGDTVGLASLIASLEEAVGAQRERPTVLSADTRPTRIGLAPLPMAMLGFAAWLVAGLAVWVALSGDALDVSDRMASRMAAGLPATTDLAPLDRSIGPSSLPPPDEKEPE